MNHDHLQPPRTSASTPLQQGQYGTAYHSNHEHTEATEVYFPKWATDKVKIAPHMMEWNRPTAVSSHGLFRRMASRASSPADTVVTVNCTRGEILLRLLPQAAHKHTTPIERSHQCRRSIIHLDGIQIDIGPDTDFHSPHKEDSHHAQCQMTEGPYTFFSSFSPSLPWFLGYQAKTISSTTIQSKK